MIKWHKKALKDFQKLPKDVQERILAAIENLPEGDVKKLHGAYEGSFRFRVGPWRVLFFYDGPDIVVFAIKHRQGAYK